MDLRENKGLTPVESGFPITSLTIDLTKRCNLACDYCFAHCFNKDRDKADLTPEMGRKAIDWALSEETRGSNKHISISFWGGEPLLRWDLMKELILYAEDKAKALGVTVEFGGTTNVTLLTEDKFDFLDEHKVYFLLSIDGRPEHHDLHRKLASGGSSSPLVLKNVPAILKRWPFYKVRLSHSVETIDTFLDDLKFLYDQGFRDIAYSPVSEGDWNEERLSVLERVWEDVADWYAECAERGDPVRLKFLDDACGQFYGRHMGNVAPCGAGRGYIGITVDGAIYPCHRFNKFDDPRPWYEREVCLGHIDYGILNQEWRNNFVKWDTRTSLCEDCSKCQQLNIGCTGGCWATNWDLHGKLSAKAEPSCTSLSVNAKIAGILDKRLGEAHRKRFALPPAQGRPDACTCYNVSDMPGTPYERIFINRADRSSCQCNQMQYGIYMPFKGCTCYNVCNAQGPNEFSYYDMTGGRCNIYQVESLENCDCKTGSRDGVCRVEEDQEIVDLKRQIAEEEKNIQEFFKEQEKIILREQLEQLREIRKAIESKND